MNQQIIQAIRYLLEAQGIVDSLARDMIEEEGSLCGLPTPKDLLTDVGNGIADLVDTLEEIEL